MKRLLTLTILLLIAGLTLGCEEKETPIEVEVTENIDIAEPISKLIEMIPESNSPVLPNEDVITLNFTEVPQNLEIIVEKDKSSEIFGYVILIRDLYHNATKTVTFKLDIYSTRGIFSGGNEYPATIRIQWKDGSIMINYIVIA